MGKYSAKMVDKIEKSKPTAFVARHASKPLSKYFTALFANIGLSPNQVTMLSFLVGLIASFFFLLGDYIWLVIAGFLTQLSLIFDSSDGELARLLNRASPAGRWWDSIFDAMKKIALFGSISIGQFLRFGNPLYFVFAFFSISNFYLIEALNSSAQLCLPEKVPEPNAKKKPEFLLKGDYLGVIDTISLAIFVFAILDQLLLLLILLSVLPVPIWANQFRKGVKKIKKLGSNVGKN